MISDTEKILQLIERDVTLTANDIAIMIGKDAEYVQKILDECDKKQIIFKGVAKNGGYEAIDN